MLHVRGGGDPLPAIVSICKSNGWVALDCSSGELISLDAPSSKSWREFQGYRDQIVASTQVAQRSSFVREHAVMLSAGILVIIVIAYFVWQRCAAANAGERLQFRFLVHVNWPEVAELGSLAHHRIACLTTLAKSGTRMSRTHTGDISSICSSIRTDFRRAHLHSALPGGGSYLTTTVVHTMPGWRVSPFLSFPAPEMESASRLFGRGCWAHITMAISSFSIRVFSVISCSVSRVAWVTGSTTSSHCRPKATSFTRLSGPVPRTTRVRVGLLRHRT